MLDFAERTLEDAENYVLSSVLEENTDLNKVKADYKAAYAFYQKVKKTIVEGKLADKTLKEMEEHK